jgi:hypothetical protein
MINWQPIKTAPKDRRILLYFPDLFSYPVILCGRWNDDYFTNQAKPYWSVDGEGPHATSRLRAHPPTHWAGLTPPQD